MGIHAAVPLIAALANVVIWVATLSQGASRRVIRIFSVLCLCVASWNLGMFSLYHFRDPESAEWWSRIFRVGMIFAAPVAYHFANAMAPGSSRWPRVICALGYLIAAALSVANLSGLLVLRLGPHYWGWYLDAVTPLYTAMTVFIATYLLLCFERMAHAYRHPRSPRELVQTKFWFLAAFCAIPLGLTNFATVYGAHVYPLGQLGNVLYTGVIAYAISRHRLMDVDYVVRKFVSFTASLAVVLVPGGIGLYQLAISVGAEAPLVVVLAAITLALAGVVLVPTLQAALETRVQQALFPRRFDYRQRLRRFAADLVHVLDEQALIQRLGDTLAEVLDVEQCRILLRDERSRAFTEVYPQPQGSALPDELQSVVEELTVPVLVAEVEARWRNEGRLLRQMEVEGLLPLRVEERVTGVILLSRNRDLLLFSGEDLQILATVAASASVALENSRLSRELRRSEAFLARANRLSSLGMLAAGIAHEIRNPLTAVKTFLDLLPQRIDDKEFLGQFRDLSLAELKRVTDLIAELLTLGKSTTVTRSDVDLMATIEPVVRLMDSTARKRQVTLRIVAQPGLARVHADPDQAKQIVLNLLLNAIEASPAGGEVMLRLRAAGSNVVLEVQDEGPGIAADQLDSIFEPFFTTKESGTGLGLALVHQMVVEHGGAITVDSEVGRGTTFRVSLPAAELPLRRTGS
ncbi:MAG TPA: ATP-binding protein [Candidatus Limnocylindria bacterium]|nr:ATP-binding protein [Candidatus Limnocylindria bacterium]